MTSLLSSCFSCCIKKKKKRSAPVRASPPSSVNGASSIVPLVPPAPPAPPQPSSLPNIAPSKKPFTPVLTYEIHSIIPKDSIKVSETTPDIPERKVLKYSCPLCFCYFNYMLHCTKCNNYICRFCADDIGNRALEFSGTARCPFCDSTPFVVSDVDTNEPVKKYTDTPYSSAVSGFKFTVRGFQGKAIMDQKQVTSQLKEKCATESGFYKAHQPIFSSTAPSFPKPETVALGPRVLIDNGTVKRHKVTTSKGIIRSNSAGKLNNCQDEDRVFVKQPMSERSSRRGEDEEVLEERPVSYQEPNRLAWNEAGEYNDRSAMYVAKEDWGRATWSKNVYKDVEVPVIDRSFVSNN